MINRIKIDVKSNLKFEYTSIILFGSYARGNFNSNSDIDIVVISDQYHEPIIEGKLSIAIYTKGQLKKFAQIGSIFIDHLIRESICLEGENVITDLKELYKVRTFENHQKELSESLILLDISEDEFSKFGNKVLHIQKFIVRSYLYHLAQKQLMFGYDIFEVIKILKKSEFKFMFDRTSKQGSSFNDFNIINSQIAKLFETTIFNPYNSLEAAIVNNYPKRNLIHTLGVSILKTDSVGIAYHEMILGND